MKRNSGRVAKMPKRMIPTTAAIVTSVTPQAGSPSTSDIAPCPWSPAAASPAREMEPSGFRRTGAATASKGRIASIGMTAISCVSRTEKDDRPPGVRIRFFSDRVCRTMAVDDRPRTMPMAREVCQG